MRLRGRQRSAIGKRATHHTAVHLVSAKGANDARCARNYWVALTVELRLASTSESRRRRGGWAMQPSRALLCLGCMRSPFLACATLFTIVAARSSFGRRRTQTSRRSGGSSRRFLTAQCGGVQAIRCAGGHGAACSGFSHRQCGRHVPGYLYQQNRGRSFY